MVRLQLRDDTGRTVGDELTAWLDPDEDGHDLRRYLLDAVSRLGREPWHASKYVLRVTDVGSGKHLIDFVTTGGEG
jgi:hypothetical protein